MLWRGRAALLRTAWVTHGASALITPRASERACVRPMRDPVMSSVHPTARTAQVRRYEQRHLPRI